MGKSLASKGVDFTWLGVAAGNLKNEDVGSCIWLSCNDVCTHSRHGVVGCKGAPTYSGLSWLILH